MQSASLPGSDPPSIAFFRMTRSRAFLAAARARAAVVDLLMINAPSPGLSSRNSVSWRPTICSTAPLTSGLPRRPFVWPSNWGSLTLTLITAIKPSRTSSPDRFFISSFPTPKTLFLRA